MPFRYSSQAFFVVYFRQLLAIINSMAHPTPIDISTIPDLARIVEEVEATREPRELRRDNKPVAFLTPVAPTGITAGHNAITKADHEAFLSAAGWKDLVPYSTI